MDTMTDARALIRAVYTEVHGQPTDPWAGKEGPGPFVAVLERHLARAIARAQTLERFLDGTVRGWLTNLDINAHAGCDTAHCAHARAYGECYDALEEVLATPTPTDTT